MGGGDASRASEREKSMQEDLPHFLMKDDRCLTTRIADIHFMS